MHTRRWLTVLPAEIARKDFLAVFFHQQALFLLPNPPLLGCGRDTAFRPSEGRLRPSKLLLRNLSRVLAVGISNHRQM